MHSFNHLLTLYSLFQIIVPHSLTTENISVTFMVESNALRVCIEVGLCTFISLMDVRLSL